MATAAELQVLIKGRDEASSMLRGFRNELRGTDMLLGQFGATSRLSSLATLGWIGAVVGAVGGAVALTKSFVDQAQEIQRLTVQTGFSAEAISRLRYQASLANTDIQELAPSLRLMSRSIMDAAAGAEAAAGAYASLGLSVQELRRMAPEQQFNTIMLALAGVTDKTKQVDLAMQLFGISGTKALLLVKDGVEGYRKAVEEAAAAAPKMTAKMVAEAEKIKRAWESAGFGLEKFKLEFVSTLISMPDVIGEAFGTGLKKFVDEMFLTVEERAAAAQEKIRTVLDPRGPEARAAAQARAIELARRGVETAAAAALAERRAIMENARAEMEASFVAAQMGRLRGVSLEEQKRLWDENTVATKAFQAAQEALLKWGELTPLQRLLIEMAEARERGLKAIREGLPIEERRLQIAEGLATYAQLEAEGKARSYAETVRIASATAVGASQERAAGIAAGGESKMAIAAMYAADPRRQFAGMASDFAGRLVREAGLGVIRGPGGEIVATTINIGQFSGTQTELDRLGESVQNANRVRAD